VRKRPVRGEFGGPWTTIAIAWGRQISNVGNLAERFRPTKGGANRPATSKRHPIPLDFGLGRPSGSPESAVIGSMALSPPNRRKTVQIPPIMVGLRLQGHKVFWRKKLGMPPMKKIANFEGLTSSYSEGENRRKTQLLPPVVVELGESANWPLQSLDCRSEPLITGLPPGGSRGRHKTGKARLAVGR